MKKKSTLKVEGKKDSVASTVGETTKKNSTDRADGLFTIMSVKQNTLNKQTLYIILRPNVWRRLGDLFK